MDILTGQVYLTGEDALMGTKGKKYTPPARSSLQPRSIEEAVGIHPYSFRVAGTRR